MNDIKISPFAPNPLAKLPPVAGFTMATAEAGVRYQGRTDVWVLKAQAGTEVAAVFTKNKCPGAPVDWSRRALHQEAGSDPRLVVVNSGTANVFAGQKGREAVEKTACDVSAAFGGQPEAVFLSSTGVIGEPLDASKITQQLPAMKKNMTADGWDEAARAIMTTDTYPKLFTITSEIDGVAVTLNGIAKGSGMIAPDMATMLSFIATDANIAQPVLQALLSDYVEVSFNSITVDSDTSTSDTVLLLASGAANHEQITDVNDVRLTLFKIALHAVMQDLALQIVKDGEGISKFITVTVSGAVDDASAKNVAMSIANSPLVKTAIAGEDANWGRIIMAVGKAGEPAKRDKLSIHMGPHLLARNGQPSESYQESDGAAYMKNAEIEITVNLGLGIGSARVYGCDLTHAYIDINADYRS